MDISNVLEEIRVKMKGDMIMAGNVSGLQAQRAGLVAQLEAAKKTGDTAAIKEAKVALLEFESLQQVPASLEHADDKPLTPEQQAAKVAAHQVQLQEIQAMKTATAHAEAWTEDTVTEFVDEFGRTHDIRIAGQYDETPIPEPQPQDIAEHDSQDAATYSYAPQKGESLADIVQAKYPNTDIKKALSEIKAANPDLENGMFKVGQKINLPTLADGTEPDLDAQVTPRGRR